jgi:CheY-like chemotaxis protein
MAPYEQFEQDLHDGLTHLYDPAFQPTDLLLAVLGRPSRQGAEPVQAALIQAIETLAPAAQVPATARSRRLHQVLTMRYLQNLCQDEAAERLGITPRHQRREQQQAIAFLARHLWKQRNGEEAPPDTENEGGPHAAAEEGAIDGGSAWRRQLQQEVVCLGKGTASASSDVTEALRSVSVTARSLTSRHSVALRLEHSPPNLLVAIPPAGLSSILMTAIMELAREMTSGEIVLCAQRSLGRIAVSIVGSPVAAGSFQSTDLQDLLSALGGAATLQRSASAATLILNLPAAGQVSVLVVDDNEDLVHFYQRYTTGTCYRIRSVPAGEQVLPAIAAAPPDVIVLDVMLPDMDGWQLLRQLREHPSAHSIPVVICSVLREEELALALGAVLYVAKPVRRQQFLEALDQALSQAAVAAPLGPASTAALC